MASTMRFTSNAVNKSSEKTIPRFADPVLAQQSYASGREYRIPRRAPGKAVLQQPARLKRLATRSATVSATAERVTESASRKNHDHARLKCTVIHVNA